MRYDGRHLFSVFTEGKPSYNVAYESETGEIRSITTTDPMRGKLNSSSYEYISSLCNHVQRTKVNLKMNDLIRWSPHEWK